MSFIIEALLALVLLVWLVVSACRRPRNFPPGPRGLPLIGYLPFIKRHDPSGVLYKSLKKLSDIYGPVVGFYLGTQPFVSVCGYEAVKEALRHPDLDGRVDTDVIKMRTFGDRLGYVFTDGEFWQEQRRFALRLLRDLGFGRNSSESVIHEEINDLLSEMNSEVANPSSGGVINFKGLFNLPMLNVLWALIGGERYSHDDARLKTLLGAADLLFRNDDSIQNETPIPPFLLRWIPMLRDYVLVRSEARKQIQDFIRDGIEQHHERLLETKDAPLDFIDHYLAEMEKVEHKNDTNSSFTKQQLICGIMDMFLAGTETTSNSLGFLLLYLIHHPEVQRKVQDELDRVCGDSLPHLAHRPSLPYTDAVLLETHRCSSILPVGVSHRAMRDTQFRGHFIPEGTTIFINHYSLDMDESYWSPDPEAFRPERHLSEDGTSVIRTDHMMPFGAGRRICMGESLARNTYYLFATALLKTFEFSGLPGQPLPTLCPNFGTSNAYEGFLAVVTPRRT